METTKLKNSDYKLIIIIPYVILMSTSVGFHSPFNEYNYKRIIRIIRSTIFSTVKKSKFDYYPLLHKLVHS